MPVATIGLVIDASRQTASISTPGAAGPGERLDAHQVAAIRNREDHERHGPVGGLPGGAGERGIEGGRVEPSGRRHDATPHPARRACPAASSSRIPSRASPATAAATASAE